MLYALEKLVLSSWLQKRKAQFATYRCFKGQQFSITPISESAARPIEDAQVMWDIICKDTDLLQILSEEGNNEARESAIDLYPACPDQYDNVEYTNIACDDEEAKKQAHKPKI